MSKANYKTIPSLLAARHPFKANSMSADWADDADGDLVYEVRSFDTVIARVFDAKADSPEVITFDEHKYSQTTSRHQNLCKAHL